MVICYNSNRKRIHYLSTWSLQTMLKIQACLNRSPEKGGVPISFHVPVGNYREVLPASIIYAKLGSIFIIMTHPFLMSVSLGCTTEI